MNMHTMWVRGRDALRTALSMEGVDVAVDDVNFTVTATDSSGDMLNWRMSLNGLYDYNTVDYFVHHPEHWPPKND